MPAITSDLDNVTWYSVLRGTGKVLPRCRVTGAYSADGLGAEFTLSSRSIEGSHLRHAGDRKAKHAPLTHVGRVSGISAVPLLGA